MPALYMSLDLLTAVKEANQGFAYKIEPCVLCSYEVACEDIVDLRTRQARAEHTVRFEELACPWFAILADGKEPPSWGIARRLHREGVAGIVVPSFAPGATMKDHNLVLWRWSARPPHQVQVFDPSGRLPKGSFVVGLSTLCRNAQGDSRWQPPACGLDVRTIATTSWLSDANLQTTSRPTWPVAPVTRIIMPLHVPS
jgi:RES domain-containing protein